MSYRWRSYIFLFVLAGVFFVFSEAAFAGESNFDTMRIESAKIKTLQADFVQKKSMKILSKPLVSEGRFYYAAPDSIRWEYLKPLRSIVIAHKNAAKRYIYSDGKMVEDKTGGIQAMKIVLDEIAGWMNGKFEQNASFKAAFKEGVNAKITLTPVDANTKTMIEKIEITLASKGRTVQSVKIFEGADTFTQIDFKKMQINKIIEPSVFQDIK